MDRKKIWSGLLVLTLIVSLFAGCGFPSAIGTLEKYVKTITSAKMDLTELFVSNNVNIRYWSFGEIYHNKPDELIDQEKEILDEDKNNKDKWEKKFWEKNSDKVEKKLEEIRDILRAEYPYSLSHIKKKSNDFDGKVYELLVSKSIDYTDPDSGKSYVIYAYALPIGVDDEDYAQDHAVKDDEKIDDEEEIWGDLRSKLYVDEDTMEEDLSHYFVVGYYYLVGEGKCVSFKKGKVFISKYWPKKP